MGRKTAEVWKFFTLASNNEDAVCNICKKKVRYNSCTSNLKKHILRVHKTVTLPKPRNKTQQEAVPGPSSHNVQASSQEPADSDPDDPPSVSLPPPLTSTKVLTQPTVTSFMKKKITGGRKNHIDQQVMKLFYLDFQPFSVVEDRGLRACFEALNPQYSIPTRKTFSNTLIPAAYEEVVHSLKSLYGIDEIMAVTLTTDCWTSISNESYMALTSHYISSQFKLESNLLGCFPFNESHTSINLANELERLALEWGIENKIILCVSDNASNIQGATRDILEWTHFGCFAHTLNLIAKSVIGDSEQITSLLQKIRSIVGHFKHSPQSSNKLNEIQVQNGLSPKKIIQDVSTRWNSTYDMLERFIELKTPIKTAIAILDKEINVLTTDEWAIADNLRKILHPLKQLTVLVSGQKYVSASSALVYVNELLNKYKAMLQGVDEDIHLVSLMLIENITEEIENRLGSVEEKEILYTATFLDPRFKNFCFSQESTTEKAKNHVIELITAKIEQEINTRDRDQRKIEEPPPEPENSTSFLSEFRKKARTFNPPTIGTSNARAIIEVQRYLDEPLLPDQEDPLMWWKSHGYNFPTLQKIVREKVCPIITSVPCERVFSKAGSILTERRSQLSSDKVEMLMMLNCNYRD